MWVEKEDEGGVGREGRGEKEDEGGVGREGGGGRCG